MKTYKDFNKIYLGDSDIAALIVANPSIVEYLEFGIDHNYAAYFVNEEIEIPEYYHKRIVANKWVKIYDDQTKQVTIFAENIEIYRAGELGCLIYAPGGKIEY